MSRIAAVQPVFPPHRYRQELITERFADVCLPSTDRRTVLGRLHQSAAVTTRHLALPIERYPQLADFTEANDAFIEVAVELGCEAVTGALAQVGMSPQDVDVIVSTTVTGLAVPSVEARVAGRIGLRPDIRRVPLFGLGCLAGAAGLARLDDLLRPDEVGVLLSIELCSLTLQRDDPSMANLVASGLFGDGGAAALLVPAEPPPPSPDRSLRTRERSRGTREKTLAPPEGHCPEARTIEGPRIIASRSHLYPDSERAMGWDIGAHGLKVVLGPEVPDLVSMYLADDVKGLLAAHDLLLDDIDVWVAHPGGPKVLTAVQDALGLGPEPFARTWQSLADVGNLSSASVLHVLSMAMADEIPTGAHGLLFAMGPGFCAELVLLQW